MNDYISDDLRLLVKMKTLNVSSFNATTAAQYDLMSPSMNLLASRMDPSHYLRPCCYLNCDG